MLSHHEVDSLGPTKETVGQSCGVIDGVSEPREHGGSFGIAVDAGLYAHSGINVGGDSRGLDFIRHSVGLHHQPADESPAVSREHSGNFERAGPWFLPASDRLFDRDAVVHATAVSRVSSRWRAALLVRVSP